MPNTCKINRLHILRYDIAYIYDAFVFIFYIDHFRPRLVSPPIRSNINKSQ